MVQDGESLPCQAAIRTSQGKFVNVKKRMAENPDSRDRSGQDVTKFDELPIESRTKWRGAQGGVLNLLRPWPLYEAQTAEATGGLFHCI